MLVSALLHLLRQDEMPPTAIAARKTEKFQELTARKMSPSIPPADLREIRNDNLEEAHMKRPLIPGDVQPEPPGWNRGHESYRRAVDGINAASANHALDIFE